MGKTGPKPTNPAERFWRYVVKSDKCWEWLGGQQRKGYGAFFNGTRLVTASRYSWELHYGLIPEGMCVLHRCDNPPCTNPDHLFLGSLKDNTRDMLEKNRGYPAKLTHCKQGHPLSGDNIKTNRHRRECRTCLRIYAAKKEKIRGPKRRQTEAYKAYQKKYQHEWYLRNRKKVA